MTCRLRPAALTLIAILTFTLQADGEIKPDQVLIVANGNVSESLRLARLYASGRDIPGRNIIALSCPSRDLISREQYVNAIATPVRTFIQQQRLAEKIRVIVTVYGMPLKVSAARPGPQRRKLANALRKQFVVEYATLEDILAELKTSAEVKLNIPTTLPTVRSPEKFFDTLPGLQRTVIALRKGLKKGAESQPTAEARQQFITKSMDLIIRLQGIDAIAGGRGINPKVPQDARRLQNDFSQIMVQPPTERDPVHSYRMAVQLGGQILLLKTMSDDFARLNQIGSQSAVDSELTLVMHRQYTLAGKIPNTLNTRLADHPQGRNLKPVFMTARLDGPTPQIVENMIRDALAVEKSGLFGKAYIDARGMTASDRGFYRYDEDLRNLAKLIGEKSKLPVVIDNKPSLFQKDTCPQAALYCGWYSLKNYIPAFRFVRGAVAYHIASFEAQHLHDRKLKLWCPKLLAAGACATLGPVNEPYLDAFPLPSEFFSLLMSGEYSLVEAFFSTKPYNSWQMVLLGDPLYRPFAKNSQWPIPNLTLQPVRTRLIP